MFLRSSQELFWIPALFFKITSRWWWACWRWSSWCQCYKIFLSSSSL